MSFRPFIVFAHINQQQFFAGIHAALVEGLRICSLRPVTAQELPLSQAARSHEAVLEPGHHGKVILVP